MLLKHGRKCVAKQLSCVQHTDLNLISRGDFTKSCRINRGNWYQVSSNDADATTQPAAQATESPGSSEVMQTHGAQAKTVTSSTKHFCSFDDPEDFHHSFEIDHDTEQYAQKSKHECDENVANSSAHGTNVQTVSSAKQFCSFDDPEDFQHSLEIDQDIDQDDNIFRSEPLHDSKTDTKSGYDHDDKPAAKSSSFSMQDSRTDAKSGHKNDQQATSSSPVETTIRQPDDQGDWTFPKLTAEHIEQYTRFAIPQYSVSGHVSSTASSGSNYDM